MTSWGWALLASAVVGGSLTIVYLRTLSRRRRLALLAMLADGDILWGAQVRQILGRGWGVSGALVAQSDGQLVLMPDTASVKRGARTLKWPLSETLLRVGSSKLDITGMRYQLVLVQPGIGKADLRFAAAQIVGDLPQRAQ